MKVKSVTIETDKGDEITMGFDEVEDFMKAMRRLKKSCQPEKEPEGPSQEERLLRQQLQMEILKLEAQRQAEMARQMQPPSVMWGSTSNQVLSASSLPNVIGNGSHF